MTREEVDWIWNQVRIGLEKLNENQLYFNARQKTIAYNPDSFNRGSAM